MSTEAITPSTRAVVAGCEAWSALGRGELGVVVLHGFTGAPAGLRPLATAIAAAGHDVELPRLPGHGTTIADLATTRWCDWYAEATRAYETVARRTGGVVVVGQSMGGALALRLALDHPGVVGVVCINPITQPRDDATMEMLDELIADGHAIIPGSGSDIADPDAREISYDGTPVAALLSLLRDGVAGIADRFGEVRAPLCLLTSRQDHVIDPLDSEHLARSYGGTVRHVWLERSYHVAVLDYDHQIIVDETLALLARVAVS